MRASGLRLVATASHKGTSWIRRSLSGPLAIFLGSEGAGLPRDLIKAMDEVVAIPQAPQVESLNVGVAASIVLYEVAEKGIEKATSNGRVVKISLVKLLSLVVLKLLA